MSIKLDTQTVGDALVNSLRERILTEEIPPGRALTEASLAEEYAVARQTAKAAIERLVTEGLLERAPHRSARVPVLDVEQVRDLYFARRFIESQAYGQLARERNVPTAASAAHAAFGKAAAAHDLVAVVDADVRLHAALVAALGSARVSRSHWLLLNEVRLCLAQVQKRHLLDPLAIDREHADILQAIHDGGVEDAIRLGNKHLDRAEAQLVAHLDHTVTGEDRTR